MLNWGRKLEGTRRHQRQEGAQFALVVFSTINLLNFGDRYVPNAVKQQIKDELELSDFQTSLPTTGMVLVFMISGLLVASVVDMELIDRRKILTFAVVFWSFATALAGFAENIEQLVFFRSLVGVGEAAYTTIVPAMLADFFPRRDRPAVYVIYYLAAPIGGAIGFMTGGVVGSAYGWRVAFFACGVPGILLAGVIPFLNDPVRGVNDGDAQCVDDPTSRSGLRSPSSATAWETVFGTFGQVLSRQHWLVATGGLVAVNFVIGGFAEWYATLLVRSQTLSVNEAGLVLGGCTIVAGIGGTLLGCKAAEHFERSVEGAVFLVPAVFMLPGALFGCLAVNLVEHRQVALLCLLFAEISYFTHVGPMATISINCMPVHLRARAASVQMVMTHLLGDVISPPIIGVISDATGSLQRGMQLAWAMSLIAGLIWWLGYWALPSLSMTSGAEGGSSQETSTSVSSLLCGVAEEAPEPVCPYTKLGYGSITIDQNLRQCA